MFTISPGPSRGESTTVNRDFRSARCGPLAFQVCCALGGKPVSVDDVNRIVSVDSEGCTLGDLDRAARDLGFYTSSVCWSSAIPPANSPPAIVPVITAAGRRHFIAMLARRGDRLLLVDVPYPPRWVSASDLRLRMHWKGEALHIAVADDSLASVRRRVDSASRRRGKILGLAAVLSHSAASATALLYNLRGRRRGTRSPFVAVARLLF
ncbi:MAG TPA: cysteine peptidase family C39 domain-containing protein [Lacipirellulaceae bacterium]|nr:cysteine peptidase family C39 domain-containing protein [Lacipirellulaceae bacterium]